MTLRADFRRALSIMLLCGTTHFIFAANPEADPNIADLPAWLGTDQYRVDPYITAAATLQKQGKTKAIATLRRAANSRKRSDQEKVIILCRMLYEPKPKEEFQRPLIGTPACLGGTDLEDWPLEPIEIVDEVPFLVVRGYRLAGSPESSDAYLTYCTRNCVWSKTKFTQKSEKEKTIALEKLATSQKWKNPLRDEEKAFLSSQILTVSAKE